MDVNQLAAAWIAVEWTGTILTPVLAAAPDDTEAGAERLMESVTAACDMAFPPRSTHLGERTAGLLVERQDRDHADRVRKKEAVVDQVMWTSLRRCGDRVGQGRVPRSLKRPRALHSRSEGEV